MRNKHTSITRVISVSYLMRKLSMIDDLNSTLLCHYWRLRYRKNRCPSFPVHPSFMSCNNWSILSKIFTYHVFRVGTKVGRAGNVILWVPSSAETRISWGPRQKIWMKQIFKSLSSEIIIDREMSGILISYLISFTLQMVGTVQNVCIFSKCSKCTGRTGRLLLRCFGAWPF